MVELTVEDHLESLNGFLSGDILTTETGEYFSYVKRLGEEFLDLPGAEYNLFVFRA